MQTAVEFIIESVMSRGMYTKEMLQEFEQAKKMEQGEICLAFLEGQHHSEKLPSQYYIETYGSKGSDETNGNNVEEVPNVVEDVFNQELFNYFSQEFNINLLNTEMHDIIDIVKNITSSQTEISDEEIEKASKFYKWKINQTFFEEGAKWYREQLKKKQ